MPRDRRIVRGGVTYDFTCGNDGYETNFNRAGSHPHGTCATGGSVLPNALVGTAGSAYSLWLEYVTELKTGAEYLWFMWYNAKGKPTIPLSGVFSMTNLAEMQQRLSAFLSAQS